VNRVVGLLALLAVALAPASVSATVARARVYVTPNPVRTGAKALAQGRGFCGRASCPVVKISLAGTIVARGRARVNGSFATRFVARVPPGTYVLRAAQGKRSATTRLHVALGD